MHTDAQGYRQGTHAAVAEGSKQGTQARAVWHALRKLLEYHEEDTQQDHHSNGVCQHHVARDGGKQAVQSHSKLVGQKHEGPAHEEPAGSQHLASLLVFWSMGGRRQDMTGGFSSSQDNEGEHVCKDLTGHTRYIAVS